MKFELTEEQTGFAQSLTELLTRSDTVGTARAWAEGDTAPGLAIWKRLAEQGVHALVVPEEAGGLGGSAVDLVVAHEVLGNQLAVGPWIESTAYLATALAVGADLEALAEGAMGTVAAPPHTPYALDAESADQVYLAGTDGLSEATVDKIHQSVDPTRKLATVNAAGEPVRGNSLNDAFDLAALATAAQLLGNGERILADSVTYVKQRKQFGREIGSYQAIKHQLADVRIALDFARPLVFGAAVEGSSPKLVSAAKVAAGDAAYLASRVGLQVHGAIGYTAEFDLSLWLTRVRALFTAWGTPAYHRNRIMESL